MNPIRKQLTAEEVSRAKDKSQKKRDKKMRARAAREYEEQLTVSTIIEPLQKIGISCSPEVSPTLCVTDSLWATNPPDLLAQIHRYQEVEENNAGWPWVGAPSKMVLQAPFAVSEYNAGYFRSPQAIQVT
jgi:hypothetical protein